MKKENDSFKLKRLTLTAWTKTLLSQGKIDLPKYEKMIRLIEKIQA